MDELIASIAGRKARLDRSRPLSDAALRQIQKHYDVDLTWTSNAIEGNTLTLRKTAEVIEHGITSFRSRRSCTSGWTRRWRSIWRRSTSAEPQRAGMRTGRDS